MLDTLLLFAQNATDQGKGGESPFGPLGAFLPLIIIFALFYLLIILPAQRREKKQRETIFSALKKNDKVLTSAGIIGTVSSIKDKEDEVTLKLEEGRIRVLKSSIVKIFGAETSAGDQKPQETGKTT